MNEGSSIIAVKSSAEVFPMHRPQLSPPILLKSFAKYSLLECLNSATLCKIFNNMNGNYDERFVDKVCALFIHSPDDVNTYKYMLKRDNIFFVQLLKDYLNEMFDPILPLSDETLQNLIDKLFVIEQAPKICQQIKDAEEKILREIEIFFESKQKTLNNSTGNLSSDSSINTISSNTDSSKKKCSITVSLFYHLKQQTENKERIDKFKALVKSHGIEMSDISACSNDFLNIELKKNQPVFLLFDKRLNDHIMNDAKKAELDDDDQKCKSIYTQIYKEYLENNESNKRFFLFTMDDFSEYISANASTFRYKWLLQSKSSVRKELIKPPKLEFSPQPPKSLNLFFQNFPGVFSQMYTG